MDGSATRPSPTQCSTVSCSVITGSRSPVSPSESHPQNPTSWSPNSTRTNKEIYNQHRATPNPAESVTFPKSAVTFAEIRSRTRPDQKAHGRTRRHAVTIDISQPSRKYSISNCQQCPLKVDCTPGPQRRVARWKHRAVLDDMQTRPDHAPDMMRIRRQTAEHPFGTIMAWMGATHFLTRTIERVSTDEPARVGVQHEAADQTTRFTSAYKCDADVMPYGPVERSQSERLRFDFQPAASTSGNRRQIGFVNSHGSPVLTHNLGRQGP